MPFEILLTFLGACTLLFLKPGPAMSVIVANSAGYGVRGGLVSVAGNVLGFFLLIAIVALGLAWIAEVRSGSVRKQATSGESRDPLSLVTSHR